MSNLQRALAQERKPGIYRFHSDASIEFLRAEAEKKGWRLFYLDGAKVSDKKSFLDKIARAMKFPDYFGKNWDALNDCLTDMGWAPASGYILVFQTPARMIETCPDDWQVAVDVFNTAIEFWRAQDVPFYVLLRGMVPRSFPTL